VRHTEGASQSDSHLPWEIFWGWCFYLLLGVRKLVKSANSLSAERRTLAGVWACKVLGNNDTQSRTTAHVRQVAGRSHDTESSFFCAPTARRTSKSGQLLGQCRFSGTLRSRWEFVGEPLLIVPTLGWGTSVDTFSHKT